MQQKISTRWIENFVFESDVNGHKLIMDADESVGGEDKGPRPKPLMLSALAGCTGMDVVSILRKMKSEPTYLNIIIDAEMGEEHPKTYTALHIIYEFKKSDNLDEAKVKKAVDLSQEKYCGVSAQLRVSADLSFEIRYA